MVNIKRVKNLKQGEPVTGPVVYWMSRDQRVKDNWALSYAVEIAENTGQPIIVVFNVVDDYPGTTWRHLDFMIKGLKKIEADLFDLDISFVVLIGDPSYNIPKFIKINGISHLIVDFDPLRIKQDWIRKVVPQLTITVDEVDAHNIVPCHLVSDKEEYAAYAIRPKISRLLPEYMDEFPPLVKQRHVFHKQRINWEAIIKALKADHSVRPVEWLVPGEKGALAVFEKFLRNNFNDYASNRNDPNAHSLSGLSPYLHFGHISAQRIALEIIRNFPRNENTDAFLEQLIIRRELSDNFCYYNTSYDSVEAFRPWTQKSLSEHLCDKRDFLYNRDQFEMAQTHDQLWNSAQKRMVHTGTMHSYLRMYWAKKILEWSESPETALNIALYLNDKYQLDGRDPNGYAGCAWSIGGVHDRAWADRKVFGKVRYMNRTGCERKFDVLRYIRESK